MPVYLDGVDKDYNGYWIVLSAEHHVYEEQQNVLTYITYLQVGTDSVGGVNSLNNFHVVKPSTIKKRTLIPNVRNVPTSKSTLKKGTGTYTNAFSQITRRAKGSAYARQTPHIWIFDGSVTKTFVTPSTGKRRNG